MNTPGIELRRRGRRSFRVTIGAVSFDVEALRRPDGSIFVDKSEAVYVRPDAFSALCDAVRNAVRFDMAEEVSA